MEAPYDHPFAASLSSELFASLLFQRYAERLLCVARDRLGSKFQAKVGAEDIVQSAFKSFFRRRDEFRFARDDEDGIWGLLLVITGRKCSKWIDLFSAEKRAVNREVSANDDAGSQSGSMQLAGREPDPQEAALLGELVEQLMNQFEPRQQEMISLRMQGYELEEIANQVASSRRTVARVIAEAKAWLSNYLPSARPGE